MERISGAPLLTDLLKCFEWILHNHLVCVNLYEFVFTAHSLNKELRNDQFLCHNFLKLTCFMIPLYGIYFKDNITYNNKFSLGAVLNQLELSSDTLFKWFIATHMKITLTNTIF